MYAGGWLGGLRRRLLAPFRKMWMLSGVRRSRERAQRFMSLVHQFAPDRERANHLDIGCNKGFLVEASMNAGWNAHGVEISWEVIRPFLNTYPHMETRVVVGAFPAGAECFDDGYFDIVTGIDIVEHFSEPRKAFDEILRVMKEGAPLVIQTPDAGSAPAERASRGWTALKPGEHLQLFNAENLEQFAGSVGFRQVRLRPQAPDNPGGNMLIVLHK